MVAKLPLFSERIYAPYKIATLVEVLSRQGIDPANSLESTGIDPGEIESSELRTSVRQYLTVCRNALKLSQDPSTAFQVGTNLLLSAYGMYGYALLCSPTVRHFFDFGVRYHKLATPTLGIHWREDNEFAIWEFDEAFLFDYPEALRRFLIEQQLAQHVSHILDVAGVDSYPVRIDVSYPAPEHAGIYQRFLKTHVNFGRRESAIYYDAGILSQKPRLGNKITSQILEQTCDRLIGQTTYLAGLSGQIYQLFMNTPGYFPTMEDAARALHMTSRTLRRRLEEEGISFTEISTGVRSSLAKEYLQATKLGIEEIAALLGFSDAANFRHAFKKWTGKSPGEFKR